MVLLPTPGPPVMMQSFSRSAAAIASRCASDRPAPPPPGWSPLAAASGCGQEQRAGAAEQRQAAGGVVLGQEKRRQINGVPVEDRLVASQQPLQGGAKRGQRAAEQRRAALQQSILGQVDVPFAGGLREHVLERGGVAGGRIGRQAQAGGQIVGGAEADAPHILDHAKGSVRTTARASLP